MSNEYVKQLAIYFQRELQLDAISHTKLAIQHLEIARREAMNSDKQYQVYDFEALETMLNALLVILEVTPH